MNIANWLHGSALINSDAPALLIGTRQVSDYSQFAQHSSSIANGLSNQFNIEPGDHIGLIMDNCIEYLEALYGIWYAGAVAVPINSKLHAREAAWILDNAEVKLVIVDKENWLPSKQDRQHTPPPPRLMVGSAEFNQLRSGKEISSPIVRAENDLAWLFYTSGTTGRPKGVMLSHSNLIAMSLCYPVDVDTVSKSDAALYAAPISHGAGLYNFIHVRAAARHIIPVSRGFDCDEILDIAPFLQNITMFAAPTMVRRLVDCAKKRSEVGEGIKTIVYGGGPMYRADITDAVETLGNRFVQIYGQGESPMTISALSRHDISDRSHSNWRARLASVGVAQSCVDIRIADYEGNFLNPEEVGEILVRGSTVMKGYWKNPEASAETLTDGWLRTGDIGWIDADGYLTLTDRSKDVIISGGSNIYPREIEEVLVHHDTVHEVAVVGGPHPEWGEEVIAFVVLEAGHHVLVEELDTFCLDRIARFKRPKTYIFLNELPKNNYGKVLKNELRDRLAPPNTENS